MRKISFIFFMLLIPLFLSCSGEKDELVGSGKIVVDKREVVGVDRIFFSGNGNLYIKQQGDEELVKIEAEDNIVPLVETRVAEGVLHISFKEVGDKSNIRSTQPINIYAKVKKLQEINLSGTGTISAQHLDIDTLKVSISGSGNTDLSVFGKTLICVLSGSGRFTLKGAVDNQDVWISGSGIYEAQELVSRVSNINVSGTGKVLVNVQDNMNVRISGSGIIYYQGNPKITQTISGSGKIQQQKENIKLND